MKVTWRLEGFVFHFSPTKYLVLWDGVTLYYHGDNQVCRTFKFAS